MNNVHSASLKIIVNGLIHV